MATYAQLNSDQCAWPPLACRQTCTVLSCQFSIFTITFVVFSENALHCNRSLYDTDDQVMLYVAMGCLAGLKFMYSRCQNIWTESRG